MELVHNSSIPEPPVWIHVPSTTYEVISSNGQLVQGEESDLLNHTRMSTIQ